MAAQAQLAVEGCRPAVPDPQRPRHARLTAQRLGHAEHLVEHRRDDTAVHRAGRSLVRRAVADEQDDGPAVGAPVVPKTAPADTLANTAIARFMTSAGGVRSRRAGAASRNHPP